MLIQDEWFDVPGQYNAMAESMKLTVESFSRVMTLRKAHKFVLFLHEAEQNLH